MKTHKQQLIFRRQDITELNDGKLIEINGGTSLACISVSLASAFLIGVVEGVANELNDDDPDEE